MATLGSLIVKIGADIKDFTGGLDRVAKSTSDFGKFAKTAGDVAAKGITVLGAAALGIGVNAGRMASDFESSFAGVKKTVDGTQEEFDALAGGLRHLAQEVPVNVNELNKIAETGGAMGVAKERLVDFTETISMISTSSNLTADSAATSFAKIGAIMGTTSDSFGRMGSSVIDLGNKGQSTESEIVEMAQRIAGAAKALDVPTADVLGISAAMADVGIEAEMGGTAVSKIMINIASDLAKGGEDVERWAQVAGMSAQQFTTAFKTDPAGAIASFVEGLGRIKDSGGNLFKTLEELDIKEVRMRDTVLRLAGARGGLTKSLDTSRQAWEANTALTEEAGKRYATTASQLQLFQNKLSDTQITLGTALLPMFLKLLEAAQPILGILKSLAEGFAALDPSTQMFIGAMTVTASVFYPAVLAIGGFIGALKNILPVIKSVWGFLMAHPFVLLAAAVVGIAWLIYHNWDLIKSWTIEKWGAITTTLKEWGDGVNRIIDGALFAIVDPIRKGAASCWNAFIDMKNKSIEAVAAMIDGIRTEVERKLTSILTTIKRPIEEVKGYFKGLYDAVVGHSYIPDMVEEIGDHMQNLDVTMTAPARNAVVNTGRVIEGGVISWSSTINQFASTANQTWGSISSTFASNIARMTDEAVNWGEVVKQMGLQLMTNMITLVIGLATQWAVGEVMRTTATAAGESARVGLTVAGNTAIVASNAAAAGASVAVWGGATAAILGFFSTIGAGFAAVIGSLVGAVVAVGTFIMGVLSAIATALSATVFGIPFAGAIVVGIGLIAAALALTDNLPEFASGGIMTGPTIGKFAEGGSAEAAIPLNDRGAAFMQKTMGLGGGGGVVIIRNELNGRVLSEEVMKNMPGVYRLKMGNR